MLIRQKPNLGAHLGMLKPWQMSKTSQHGVGRLAQHGNTTVWLLFVTRFYRTTEATALAFVQTHS